VFPPNCCYDSTAGQLNRDVLVIGLHVQSMCSGIEYENFFINNSCVCTCRMQDSLSCLDLLLLALYLKSSMSAVMLLKIM